MIYEQFKSNNADILIWEITESADELIGVLSNFECYKTEYESIKTDKRRIEFLAARVAINQLLAYEKMIVYDTSGKPFLKDEKTFISISHSKKWLALIAHPEHKTGIDIECPTEKIVQVYKRFLNPTEQKELYDEENSVKLQLAWSAKEALFKIIGDSAVDFAKQLHIFPFELKDEGYIKAEHLPCKDVYDLYYKVRNNYNLVYCIA